MTAALGVTAAVVAALAALGLAVLKWAPCPGCAHGHQEAG